MLLLASDGEPLSARKRGCPAMSRKTAGGGTIVKACAGESDGHCHSGRKQANTETGEKCELRSLLAGLKGEFTFGAAISLLDCVHSPRRTRLR